MERVAAKNLSSQLPALDIAAISTGGAERNNNRMIQPFVGVANQEPRRIAYVLPWPGIGGAEVATWRVAHVIEESGDFRSVAFCHGDGQTEVARMFDEHAMPVVSYTAGQYSYRHPMPFVRGVFSMARALRRQKIDLVHCADLMGAYHAGTAAKLARVPVVCHIRSNFEDFPARYKPPLATIDRFIFVSHATWRNFNNIFRVSKQRGTVIYDWAPVAREVEDNAEVRARVRREFGIAPDAAVFGMVARVAPQKDFETLLRASAQVMTARPDSRLLLVGEHDESSEETRAFSLRIRALAEELRIADRIIWTGFRSDVPDLMRAMDVFVLCTHSEGFPLVLLEAMSLALPVIGSAVGGVPEIISRDETGLLHERGDAKELAQNILRLINDTSLATALGERGQKHVREQFTQERTIKEVKNVYKRLLDVSESAEMSPIPGIVDP